MLELDFLHLIQCTVNDEPHFANFEELKIVADDFDGLRGTFLQRNFSRLKEIKLRLFYDNYVDQSRIFSTQSINQKKKKKNQLRSSSGAARTF